MGPRIHQQTNDYESWKELAECGGANPEVQYLFHDHDGEKVIELFVREAAAKEICKQCVVRQECLDYSLAIRAVGGIWGGKNSDERKAFTRGRRRRSA